MTVQILTLFGREEKRHKKLSQLEKIKKNLEHWMFSEIFII